MAVSTSAFIVYGQPTASTAKQRVSLLRESSPWQRMAWSVRMVLTNPSTELAAVGADDVHV